MADNHFKINKGVTLNPQAGAPANPTNGDIYYDTSLNQFRKYEAGAWSAFSGGGGTITGATNLGTGSQVFKQVTGTNLDFRTLLAGDGMTLTQGTNEITIANMPTTEVTTTSQSMAVNNAYIANNAALVTLTLPVTAAVGTRMMVVGKGAGGWKIAQNASQQIFFGSSSSLVGTTGYINSTDTKACVELICITANTSFVVVDSEGTYSTPSLAKGYVHGGFTGTSTYLNSTDSIIFSTEAQQAVSAVLSEAKSRLAGTESSLKGYFHGGELTGTTATQKLEAFTFSTETYAEIGTNQIGEFLTDGCGVSSSLAAYHAGGYTSVFGYYTKIRKTLFSSETTATLAATLDIGMGQVSTAGCSGSLKGYYIGGEVPGNSSKIEDQDFTSDTSATIAATLAIGQTQLGSCWLASQAGYPSGGGSGPATLIQKLLYSTEVRSSLAATLNTGKSEHPGVGSFSKGYYMGGYTTTSINVIEDLNFTTETSDVITAVLGVTRSFSAGTQG
jgi:hypothetical protein